MSSSTTALTVPSATPHLRVVRSLASDPSSADRRRTPVQPRPGLTRPEAVRTPAPAVLEALPEGATVIGALPESALHQDILARYSAELGVGADQPLVGYLVLVPAEEDRRPTGPSPVPATSPQAVHPTPQGIRVDTDRRNAYVDGELLDLTYLEFELLAHLTRHPHRVHTREHLVSAVWGYVHVGDGRTVDVHVARLRRKLGPAYRDGIVTVRRVGYKYSPTH